MKPGVNLDCTKLCRNRMHFIYFFQFPKISRPVAYATAISKVKSSPTGHVGPEGSRRVKAPSFRDNGTLMVVGCQPYPQEHS